MATLGIAYVEIYAGDDEVAAYYTKSLGFTQVAYAAADGSTSKLLGQGTSRLIVTTGAAAAPFVRRHGDGVADIAFTCDDVVASTRAAQAAGAPVTAGPAGPVVSGPGELRHTLLPADSAGPALPPGHAWLTGTSGGDPVGRVQELDHVAICLAGGTLASTADFYTAALGLARYSSEYVATGDQGMDSIVVRSETGGVTFTLVASDPAKEPGQLDSFIARNDGPGVQHLAFAVDEIIAAIGEYHTQGVDFLSVPRSYYDNLAVRLPALAPEVEELRQAGVLADRDEWGHLLQVFTRSPHERNTMFYELVQRQGARGFGSANIRALYEAVERDRLVGRAKPGDD